MVAIIKNLENCDQVVLAKLDAIRHDIEQVDRKVEKLDARMWQIIILLLSYPLGLIVGKITHIF